MIADWHLVWIHLHKKKNTEYHQKPKKLLEVREPNCTCIISGHTSLFTFKKFSHNIGDSSTKKLRWNIPISIAIGQRYKNENSFVYFESSYWIIIKKRQKKECPHCKVFLFFCWCCCVFLFLHVQFYSSCNI